MLKSSPHSMLQGCFYNFFLYHLKQKMRIRPDLNPKICQPSALVRPELSPIFQLCRHSAQAENLATT